MLIRRSRLAPRASLLIFFALVASQLFAATVEYVAKAGARPQIDSITVSGTWAAGETGTVTIGNSSLIVTCGTTTTTTSQVADVIKRAINATQIDGNLVGDESRSFAGQLVGEFRDVEAIIDPTNTSRVLVRSVKAGVPWGTPGASGGPISAMTVADTAAAGALARASVQTATGPWHWDNATNWSGGAVPANNDTVVFAGTKDGPKYGLPDDALEVYINQYQSFEGWIGLPLLNMENGVTYSEYRQRFVRLNDAGAASDAPHRFGLGVSGKGSSCINVRQKLISGSPVVYNTGPPLREGLYALNICCTVTTSSLNVLAGSVDFSSVDGSTSAYGTYTQTGGTARGIKAIDSSATVKMHGGTCLLGSTTGIGTVSVRGGTARFENQTGTVANMEIYPAGTVEWASTGTITGLTIMGGTFDARGNAGTFSVGTVGLWNKPKYLDPYKRTNVTGNITLYGDPSAELQFGNNEFDGLLLTP